VNTQARPDSTRSSRRPTNPVDREAASQNVRLREGQGPMTNANFDDDLADRLAYSVEEAARVTGLSRDLLYDQMRAGKLLYLKVGRRRIITRQHLEAFLTTAS
jgi:excisionase family DNA binding protein